MRRITRYLANIFYKPLLIKWLSKERNYSYKGILLKIHPAVFHPGFFFSTLVLLRYINTLSLPQRSFLELGAGSGLISIVAAQKGAIVTATDINPVAIEYLEKNKKSNHAEIQVIQSDLFENIPPQAFDIIAINPPYYKKQPQSAAEYAWYCGENGEYFERLFAGLSNYVHQNSIVLMILCDGCDLEMIYQMANKRGFRLNCVQTTGNLVEDVFIFTIEQTA